MEESQTSGFDSHLGGDYVLPSGLKLSEFIKHRMEEVVMLTETIEESPFRGQAFQRLPKHMRRRQMSHYIKRLPRRLQRPYLLSLKEEPPAPTKRPSRKFRRRPGNLLLEYNRRQKNLVWLETHIWHAKRYHMTTKWGYKLPEKSVNKSFKACYRAISKHCLLIDKSYYNCIELKGSETILLGGLKQCTSPDCGLTFGAKMYLSGTREGSVVFFKPNLYPYGVIGRVSFMWDCERSSERRIWIWVHPSIHSEMVECFKVLFDLVELEDVCVEQTSKKSEEVKLETKNVPFVRTPKFLNETKSVMMTLLKDTLNRFQLIGPLSQAVVSQAFTIASQKDEVIEVEPKKRKTDEPERKNWWEKYHNRNWFDKKKYEKMSECLTPSDVPMGMILGLVIEDPRLRILTKREKAVPEIEDPTPLLNVERSFSESPIWISEVRDEVSMTKLTTHEINEAKARKIVPGFDAVDVIPDEKQSRIPVLVVQQPGTNGLGCGWDIIAPAGFGMPIWLSLIFKGARTGGLRESEQFLLECTNLNGFLPPDSIAGEKENQQNLETLKTRYFKLPPNKRPNYTKLGIVSPFYQPWKVLVRDWTQTDEEFSVLRNWKTLQDLCDIVNKFTKGVNYSRVLNWSSNNLIPVVIECTGRGKPTDHALICLPEDDDFKNSTPTEPTHVDINEKQRKILKLEHSKLLKCLRRKRRKDKAKLKEEFGNNLPGKLKWKEIIKTNTAPSDSHSKEYKTKMEELWLPSVENLQTVIDSCCRKILGFVIKGEFSYAKSKGLGLGYVTLPGLIKVLDVCRRNKSKVVVLVRNRNQVQYRLGELKIAVE